MNSEHLRLWTSTVQQRFDCDIAEMIECDIPEMVECDMAEMHSSLSLRRGSVAQEQTEHILDFSTDSAVAVPLRHGCLLHSVCPESTHDI